MRWSEFERKVVEKKLTLLTPLNIGRLFSISAPAARNFLYRRYKSGDLIRLKRGLYMLALHPVSNYFYLANKLYEPSYISLESALSFHGLIPETVYQVTSATTKKTKIFNVQEIVFSYHHIKKEAFTGYAPLPYQGTTIFMADPEKALADYLYLAALRGEKFSRPTERIFERLRTEKLNKAKALKYAELFSDKRLVVVIEERIR